MGILEILYDSGGIFKSYYIRHEGPFGINFEIVALGMEGHYQGIPSALGSGGKNSLVIQGQPLNPLVVQGLSLNPLMAFFHPRNKIGMKKKLFKHF